LASDQAQGLLADVADREWMQHQYQYYKVQSVDIVQMPRMPELDDNYLSGISSPAFFAVSDFLQPEALVTKLSSHADPVSLFLWQQFSPQTQAALQKLSGDNEAASLLADELNNVIPAAPLFEATRFGGVKLSEETKALAGRSMSGHGLARLNRLLIEDAYPAEVGRRPQLAEFGRLWQLTNTRYVLGMRGFLDVINQQIDPTNQSFTVKAAFDFVSRDPGSASGGAESITTLMKPDGAFAIFEFGAALPRAKLYNRWRTMTNEASLLGELSSPAFDPSKTLLVANGPAVENSGAAPAAAAGSVTITRYEPKYVALKAEPSSPSVLLLNDKFDPAWKVSVDGKPEPLLRCNFIMRGVFLPPGSHNVEFRFDPPHGMLYVSVAAIATGIALCGFLSVRSRQGTTKEPQRSPAPAKVKSAT
jgi:hypothetical protein